MERVSIQSGSKSFATCSFKKAYEEAQCPTWQHQIFTHLQGMLINHFKHHGVDQSYADAVLKALQKEAFKSPDRIEELRGEVPYVAQRMWTSAQVVESPGVPLEHRRELCSIINAVLREDKKEVVCHCAHLVRCVHTRAVCVCVCCASLLLECCVNFDLHCTALLYLLSLVFSSLLLSRLFPGPLAL
jgi:hypothetical protein